MNLNYNWTPNTPIFCQRNQAWAGGLMVLCSKTPPWHHPCTLPSIPVGIPCLLLHPNSPETLGDLQQSHCHLQRGQSGTLEGKFGQLCSPKAAIPWPGTRKDLSRKAITPPSLPKVTLSDFRAGICLWYNKSRLSAYLDSCINSKIKKYNQLPLQFFRKPGNSLPLAEGDCSTSNSFCISCKELWFSLNCWRCVLFWELQAPLRH